MNKRISKIENDVQDRNSVAWKKLCAYVDKVAAENRDEFSPVEELGQELFAQIHTLPETISKLTKVKKVWLYGSKLKRIPPEIGQMEALEYFDPYTSYDLHWFPYEITKCKNLKDSRVSTRALYGNWKNRMGFPRLTHNPVRYSGDTVNCSVCGKTMTYEQTNQLWISLNVGTDVLPLLTNLCSKECERKLPTPPKDYVQFAHKGGADLEQPLDEDERFELEMKSYDDSQSETTIVTTQNDINDTPFDKPTDRKEFPLLKLIRKIW
ncbi:hypothetical protein SAMN05444377_11742 [Flavobacterium fontis]|uniref:Leucine rich repeat-containing protein n=1 Tax=Flavobacterium fontis TaxID=1124188 RepID=A0A1M5E350_9FLAO|nr:hypothetical protein [Flavobacterium fontis]SHF73501.1 hypothetical protein SAMN05444377_11742 [Flavobacterium fontis]